MKSHYFNVLLLNLIASSAAASPPAIVPFTGYVSKDVSSINLQLELVNPESNQILWCQKTADLPVAKRRFMVNIGLVGGDTSVCVEADYADLVTDGLTANLPDPYIFTLETFTDGQLQVRIKIDGARMSMPQALNSLPYAAIAHYAERAKSFTVERELTVQQSVTVHGSFTATQGIRSNDAIVVDGQTVIDNNAGWHRSYGNTGWYNGTHEGGWYMRNQTYIENYGNKKVKLSNDLEVNGRLNPLGNFDLRRRSCTWRSLSACGHGCGTGTTKSATCPSGYYLSGLRHKTWNDAATYNWEFECCKP